MDYEKARIILRIWKMYADGISPDQIAKALNDDQLPAPGSRRPNSHHSLRWTRSTIVKILRQEKYLGIWKYRQTKTIKNPRTDKLVQKERPKNEWIVAIRDDLRIVPVEIETKVRKKLSEIAERLDRRKGDFGRKKTPNHLFTGTLVCGDCGGNMIRIGTGRHGGGYMGCINAHREASQTCTNKKMVNMSWIEETMLREIRIRLESHACAEEMASIYNAKVREKSKGAPEKMNEVMSELAKTQQSIENFLRFIESGNWSETVTLKLAEAERKMKELKEKRK